MLFIDSVDAIRVRISALEGAVAKTWHEQMRKSIQYTHISAISKHLAKRINMDDYSPVLSPPPTLFNSQVPSHSFHMKTYSTFTLQETLESTMSIKPLHLHCIKSIISLQDIGCVLTA